MSNTEANKPPSGEALATTILASFGAALQCFDEFWCAGWGTPANERACVAKVAVDLTNKLEPTLQPWCEISLRVLCQSNGHHEIPEGISKRGRVDLVLCNSTGKSILALVEFKTNESTDDKHRLIRLRELLAIPNIIVVSCCDVRRRTDIDTTIVELDDKIQTKLLEARDGWQVTIEPDRPHIHINSNDGGMWFVRPFVMWQSD